MYLFFSGFSLETPTFLYLILKETPGILPRQQKAFQLWNTTNGLCLKDAGENPRKAVCLEIYKGDEKRLRMGCCCMCLY